MERLRHEGEGILLIYDNAIDADGLKPYLPRGGAAKVLVTSNAHTWGGVAAPVEMRLWPKQIGADCLIARTGRDAERAAAEILSEALGGLPLAHEQAAAYCERLDISLGEYRRRFETAPARMLDDTRHAPAEYHDGLTVAKTFELAIEEAAKLHPTAEPLIFHAALLAPEPIPLFVFAEAREKFGEPLSTVLTGDGLEEAVAALRTFALVSRETITDECHPDITTETVRLHRLVHHVAATRRGGKARDDVRRVLIEALATTFPEADQLDPKTWPRARRLDPLAVALIDGTLTLPEGAEAHAAELLHRLSSYYFATFASYPRARLLDERALSIREKVLGPEHPDTAASLNLLGFVIERQGDHAEARALYERALAINEKVLGRDHPATARSIHHLGRLLFLQGDLVTARSLHERAIASFEKALGPEHVGTLLSYINFAGLLQADGALDEARSLHERILARCEKVLGPDHPHTAYSLRCLASCLEFQGDLAQARPLKERAVTICERVLGPEHPDTALSLADLADCLQAQDDFAGAQLLYERALAICEKVLGSEHLSTASCLMGLAVPLHTQGDLMGAQPLCERALAIRERLLGPAHRATAQSVRVLADLLRDQGDFSGSRRHYHRALATFEMISSAHPHTNRVRCNLARLLMIAGSAAEALTFSETALAAHEKVLGKNHR